MQVKNKLSDNAPGQLLIVKKLYRRSIWPLVGSIAALLISVLFFNFYSDIMPTPDDVSLYHRYATWTLEGFMPYRDFKPEYPPFALVFFLIPAIVGNLLGMPHVSQYTIIFQTQEFILTVATLWLVWLLLRRIYRERFVVVSWRTVWYTLAALAICLYIFRRFDIGATFLVALAVYYFYDDKPGRAGIFLGLGTAAKLFPVILLPLALIYYWQHKNEREAAWRALAGFTAAVVGVVLPFALVGMEGLLDFLKYHGQRGVQVESIFAGFIYFGRELGLVSVTLNNDFGSLNYTSAWTQTLASFSTMITVGGLLLFYYWMWRAAAHNNLRVDWFIQVASIAVLWFILVNKVLSPQYMVWLLIFAPFWRGNKFWVYLVALPLSTIPFPFLIVGISRLEPLPMVILAIRNVLLVVLLVLMVRELWRESSSTPVSRAFKPAIGVTKPQS